MTYKLLSPEDLYSIIGKKRYSAQAQWFEENFKINVVRRVDGSVVMTQEVFEALLAKRMGLQPKIPAPPEIDRPKLRPLRNTRK